MAFVPNWSPTAYYNQGDEVIYNNITYTLTVPGSTAGVFGNPPPSNPAAWQPPIVPPAPGNWSYFSLWSNITPPSGGYTLNCVVFDTVNIGQTYVCILAYTPTGGDNPPSLDATHWQLFATNVTPTPISGVTTLNTLSGALNVLARSSGQNITMNVATGLVPDTISIWTPQLIQSGTLFYSNGSESSLPVTLSQVIPIPYATANDYIVIATISDLINNTQPTWISLTVNATDSQFDCVVNTLAGPAPLPVDWVINWMTIGPNPIGNV